MTHHDLLLLSSSSLHGQPYLDFAMPAIEEFLAGRPNLVFVPFALASHDAYTERVSVTLSPLGVTVTGLHTVNDPVRAVTHADVIFIGGGNSFRLLRSLQLLRLIEPVRQLVEQGKLAYMGASAGTNMACPSLRTTNDMPIVQPDSYESFGLIPFQINPHYIDPDPNSTHMGETREQRIAQFHEENDVAVLGLREGAWLLRKGNTLTLHGPTGARLMQRDHDPVEYRDEADLSFLLNLQPRFDSPIG